MKIQISIVAAACLCALLLIASCARNTPTVSYTPPVVSSGTVSVSTPSVTPEATPQATPTDPVPGQTKKNPNKNANNQGLSKAPRVEVVFVLDTTGSMGGLLTGAKQKVWSIANAIQQAQPKPIIQIGLVGYRDKGDEYVTKVHGLSDNMDKVYENLMAFQANGGGDEPEHVNKALYDAVHSIQWSKGKNVMRVIFLAGDAPPHMDYQDGFDYKKVCSEARQMDIIINTICCGNSQETVRCWKDIASLAGGKYVAIEQTGGVVATVDTPFDKDLATMNSELGTTLVPYGSSSERESTLSYQKKSEAMAPAVQAERAAFSGGGHYMAKNDLVDAVKNKDVNLDDIKKADMPAELQKMNKPQQVEYLKQQAQKRDDLKSKIADLSKKREAYIKSKQGEKKDSFDNQVLSFIRDQAQTKGLTIK